MSSREIAELTGKLHANVIRDIRKMLSDIGNAPDLGDHSEHESNLMHLLGDGAVREERDARGYTAAFHLSKELTITLISGYDARLRLSIIRRWTELESGAAQSQNRVDSSEAVEAVQIAEALANMLNLTGSARLGMARGVIGIVAPRLLPVVPAYAIDAPSDSASGSSEPTASLTTLLSARGVEMSAIKANRILQSLGLITQLSRPSRSGINKTFWSVTESGRRYGKNVTNEKNQNETQPHWFVSRGDELAALVLENVA